MRAWTYAMSSSRLRRGGRTKTTPLLTAVYNWNNWKSLTASSLPVDDPHIAKEALAQSAAVLCHGPRVLIWHLTVEKGNSSCKHIKFGFRMLNCSMSQIVNHYQLYSAKGSVTTLPRSFFSLTMKEAPFELHMPTSRWRTHRIMSTNNNSCQRYL